MCQESAKINNTMEETTMEVDAPPPSPPARGDEQQQEEEESVRPPLNPLWTYWTDRLIHRLVPEIVTAIALIATRRPRITLASIIVFSLALAMVGYSTNFKLDVDQFEAYAPYGVRPRSHRDWIDEESGFPSKDILFLQLVHANGDNVVGRKGIQKAFEAYRVVNTVAGYKDLCAQSNYQFDNQDTCQVSSVLRFWNYNQTLFEESVQRDGDVMAVLLQENFPDGTPVDTGAILGNYKTTTNDEGTVVVTAQSFPTAFFLPDIEDETATLEEAALEATFPVRDDWAQEEGFFQLEVISEASYALEFTRAIEDDLLLVPLAFLIMAAFTCTIFFRRHPVQSRLLLGLGAVVTIVCSLLSGYGFMFLCGVPLNNLTTLVPFVVFGVGLDDTFIITGAFARTKKGDSLEDRIRQTIKDVGVSISVTTLSTSMALGLGAISNIPAVRWLCLYAMVVIIVDYIYQISMFIALLVLDERRIQANRRDCCVCLTVANTEETVEQQHLQSDADQQLVENHRRSKPSFVDRMMVWYADRILHPVVKVIVLVGFTALFGGCAYSASKLTQEFKITELVPSDSYVLGFLDASDSYTSRLLPTMAYFRFVDQSATEMQQQMINFVDKLSNLTQFGDDTQFCWVKDFQTLLSDDSEIGIALQNMTFNEQIQVLLTDPTVKEVYGNNIVLDQEGNIKTSRCLLFVVQLDWDDVDDQIELLHGQEQVSMSQPVNQDHSDWAFFSHDDFYLTWEFYAAIEQEFIFTAVVGVVAVTAIGFLCIPHWTASLFVLPMMGVLYVDLIGIIQAAGLHINVVTHVVLAMSIGLLVDYLVHVLLRYYESSKFPTREEKVKDTLRTMGAAVLSGGLSTLLGVLPLALSTSEVMRTVFVSFLAMVTLGCGHGLMFLPVLLSVVGPETTPSTSMEKESPESSKAAQPGEEKSEEIVTEEEGA